jgi:NADH-quinone oxidoreductase subunit G
VCQGCSTGCNAYLDFDPRSQKAYRHRPRENEEINKYWMCDVGMLSYDRAHVGRITAPSVAGQVVSTKAALEAVRKSFAGVSADQIAVVLSAQHSSEDNFALATLAKTFLGAGDFFLAGKAKGQGDGVLMDADHNPNTRGAVQVASTTPPRPFEDLATAVSAGKYTHVLALGADVPVDPSLLDGFGRLAGFVAVSAHEGPLAKAAKIVLPACSWAEADGTFVTGGGIAQRSERAIHPQGESRPGWEWVGLIGDALGHGLPLRRLGDIRKAMATEPNASLPPASMPAINAAT